LPSLSYGAVLFDLDGTLIDSSQGIIASVRYALRKVDPRDPPGPEDILLEVGKPLELILRDLGYQTDEAGTEMFVDTYRAHYAEHFKDQLKLYPGVDETLQILKDSGLRQALVTTKHQLQAEFTAKACGLARYFDYIHGFLEGRKHKPDPEPVLVSLDRLGVRPESALMVGDSELDMEAGRAAGTATCGVTYGFRPAELLMEYKPDFLISCITDVVFLATSQGRREKLPSISRMRRRFRTGHY